MNSNADDFGAKLVKALMDDSMMEETRDYLVRGRRFAGLEVDGLKEVWLAAFRLHADLETGPHVRDMEDAGAEFRLRGLNIDVPWHLVSAEFERLQDRVGRAVEEARSKGTLPALDQTTEIGRRIAELTGQIKKPKN